MLSLKKLDSWCNKFCEHDTFCCDKILSPPPLQGMAREKCVYFTDCGTLSLLIEELTPQTAALHSGSLFETRIIICHHDWGFALVLRAVIAPLNWSVIIFIIFIFCTYVISN